MSGTIDLTLGHSPDPDDAFMYWALTTDLVDPRGFDFEQVLADIESRTGVTVLVAPGPEVTRHTPTRPLARA